MANTAKKDDTPMELIAKMVEAAKIMDEAFMPIKGRMVWKDGILYKLDEVEDRKSFVEILSV